MKVCGIVSEYNPFHNGHKYLIDKAKENGATHIAAIMGGCFLQRGECAVTDKFSRAAAAVRSGADLVIELPAIFATAGAESFAYGAVATLTHCGCIDELCFGAECGSTEKLVKAALLSGNAQIQEKISQYSKIGYSYPRAFSAAAAQLDESESLCDILFAPNNTLALEYIKALDKTHSKMIPFAVQRSSVNHNSDITNGSFASASAIRKKIIASDNSFFDYIPTATGEIIRENINNGKCPPIPEKVDLAYLSVLRRMSVEQLSDLPNVTEGLENRIFRAIKESTSVEQIIAKIKCKRYTHARLNRILTSAYLGITKNLSNSEPAYIRPLAFNEKGTQILKAMKTTAALPIIMSVNKDKNLLDDNGKAILEKDILASDLYNLLLPATGVCSQDYYRKTGLI